MKEKTQGMLPDIRRTLVMDAPIEKVWNAIATSEGLAVWLMPNDFQPVMGHEFTFRSEPRGDWDGIVHCKVTELDPPKRLAFTWCGNHMEQYVSFELKELGGKTEFTLVHAGWSEEHAALREVMYDGWGYLTEGLRDKLGDKNGGYLS
ncbi:MAG: SRPBCC family protein [Bacillota bacterium]